MKKFQPIFLIIPFVIICFIAVFYFGFKQDIYYCIIDALISALLFYIASLSFKYQARFIDYSEKNLLKFSLSHLLAAAIVSIIWVYIVQFFIENLLRAPIEYTSFYNSTIIWRILLGLFAYFIIVAFYYLSIYYDNYKENLVRETELKNLITEAEIKTLKFQINPHFIFNSLNSIAALTSIDANKARDMTIKLADFLRFTLSNDNKKMNKIEDEIQNIERYLAIEKIRFADKFSFVTEIDDKCFGVEVPNMILQPLFENAIKYGVYEALNSIKIKLMTKCMEDYLSLSVENDYEDAKTSFKGEGVGLNNIKDRLRLIYNRNDLFKIEKGEKFFRVVLYIPITN
jgi:sensor histidine kinase YesM